MDNTAPSCTTCYYEGNCPMLTATRQAALSFSHYRGIPHQRNPAWLQILNALAINCEAYTPTAAAPANIRRPDVSHYYAIISRDGDSIALGGPCPTAAIAAGWAARSIGEDNDVVALFNIDHNAGNASNPIVFNSPNDVYQYYRAHLDEEAPSP